MQAVQTQPQLMDLAFTDWEGFRRAELEGVPRDATVGELMLEAVRAMGLPLKTYYHTYLRDRQLNQGETLQEAGIESAEELRIVPEVSAG